MYLKASRSRKKIQKNETFPDKWTNFHFSPNFYHFPSSLSCAWRPGPASGRAVWRCWGRGSGAPCVTTCGTSMQPPWCAESWDLGQPKRPSPRLSWDRVRRHTYCKHCHTHSVHEVRLCFEVFPVLSSDAFTLRDQIGVGPPEQISSFIKISLKLTPGYWSDNKLQTVTLQTLHQCPCSPCTLSMITWAQQFFRLNTSQLRCLLH